MADATSPDLPVLTTLREGVPPVIESESDLAQAVGELKRSTEPVAVDTERAQGFRYGSSAWLVQIRREDVGTFLIDSHALSDLEDLNQVLQTPWILHSAKQDLPALAEANLVPPQLFDTETAARLLGLRHFSLLAVCETVLGVSLEKSHQAEDWSIRPLPTDWLRYAALDVELLPELYQQLTDRLRDKDRLSWADQEFEYARTHVMHTKEPSWENLKGVRKLRQPRQLAVAKELWTTREAIARDKDVAPTRVLPSKAIIEAALRYPDTRRKMLSIPDFHRPRARAYKDDFWAALRRAQTLTATEMPQRQDLATPGVVPPVRHWKRTNPEALERLQLIRTAVQAAAEPVDLEPEVVLEPAAQRAATWEPLPASGAAGTLLDRLVAAEARPWQLELTQPALERVFA